MKNCPNCQSEIEDNFEVCWNCNYSLSENKIVEFKDNSENSKEIDCLRCKVPLIFSGNYKFHEGAKIGLLGNLFELFVNRESFDLYICPKCGKVEFYSPLN
jgi:Zn finger protein HypA/HybF involved in hydrogenase expression